MKTRLLGGLCVAMLCGGWAEAESLAEAVARLDKAAAGVRDLAIKFALDGASYRVPEGSARPVKKMTISGTAEFQMLRDAGKCLMRVAASTVQEWQGTDPAAPPERRQENQLVVNDGQFHWTEARRSGSDVVSVRKEGGPADGLNVRGRSQALLDGAYRTRGLKGEIEELAKRADVRLGGKGSVAGRATTIIELSARAKRPDDPNGLVHGMPPARSVCELDDATGAALALKDLNWVGDMVMSISATEVKVNSGIDRKLFSYTPPAGAKVRDVTQPPEKQAQPTAPEAGKNAP